MFQRRNRADPARSSANYAYPWRDNFCERRGFPVGQCPAGLGHQGQDIRTAALPARPFGERCYGARNLVAVRDGAILRRPKQEAVYLFVNTANEHIRFRYLHMLPRKMDEDSLLSGRRVHEGEVIGQVGNFSRRRRRHQLSSAFRRAGADTGRLGVRQSVHDAGGRLRTADRRARRGSRAAGHYRDR